MSVSATISAAIRYRCVKVYANTSKVTFSLLLRIFPKWRKTIPSFLPPRRPSPSERYIPRIVWQTNYTQRVTPQVYACFLFNRFLTPTYAYHFFSDEQCDKFVEENYPGEIWRAFSRLRIGAARADFWRILILLKHGGIYMDIDANLTDYPDKFIADKACVFLISMKNGELTNYFIASAPKNPILEEVCKRIVRNINDGTLTSVYELTGPAVLEAIVKERGITHESYKKACIQGQFTTKRGQYADKPKGIWKIAQQVEPIVAPATESARAGASDCSL